MINYCKIKLCSKYEFGDQCFLIHEKKDFDKKEIENITIDRNYNGCKENIEGEHNKDQVLSDGEKDNNILDIKQTILSN